jgi:hypothetical protein
VCDNASSLLLAVAASGSSAAVRLCPVGCPLKAVQVQQPCSAPRCLFCLWAVACQCMHVCACPAPALHPPGPAGHGVGRVGGPSMHPGHLMTHTQAHLQAVAGEAHDGHVSGRTDGSRCTCTTGGWDCYTAPTADTPATRCCASGLQAYITLEMNFACDRLPCKRQPQVQPCPGPSRPSRPSTLPWTFKTFKTSCLLPRASPVGPVQADTVSARPLEPFRAPVSAWKQ